jgi:hypothetical protein
VEAFDVLVELATEERWRREVIELLSEDQGAWRSVMEPLDAQVLKATLYESMGLQENAAAALSQAFHATLDADDEWSLGKAEALFEDIQVLAGEEAAAPLAHRLKQTREVFERRSRSSAMMPLSELRSDLQEDEEEFYGLILIVGGNETQESQDAALIAWAKQKWPEANFAFRRTGWSSNWGDQLKSMESDLGRARAMVIMRYIRTSLGQALRRKASELDVPWVACTGSGRASMQRALEEAILLARRHSG